jgi:hypothetical protein
MLDLDAESSPDLRPALVICAYDQAETAWDPIEDLSGRPWSPPGARTIATAADEPGALAETLIGQLSQTACRGILLIGRTRQGNAFRVQTRAENRIPGQTDRIDRAALGLARVTAPVADMVRALGDAGLTALATSDPEDDQGDYLLFRVLNALPDGSDTPAVGLIRAPVDLDDDAVTAGIKAAAGAIASHLAPLPRRRAL